MMGSIYESEIDDTLEIIALIFRFGCDYELKYVHERASTSQIFSIFLHYFNLRVYSSRL